MNTSEKADQLAQVSQNGFKPNLLKDVIRNKTLALMQSPEVIEFLREQQKGLKEKSRKRLKGRLCKSKTKQQMKSTMDEPVEDADCLIVVKPVECTSEEICKQYNVEKINSKDVTNVCVQKDVCQKVVVNDTRTVSFHSQLSSAFKTFNSLR